MARRTGKAGAIVFLLALVYVTSTIIAGYVRAPQIVAHNLRLRDTTLNPRHLTSEQLRILLAVEDPRFFSHHGVDLTTPGAGMTTITQGLVKFLYFKSFRPGLAKIPQTLLALGFDARTEKSVQLSILLNSANFGSYKGREVRGFENAAHAYFGKPFGKLTRHEFVSLVAMCVGPNEYNVVSHPERNSKRVTRIERMLRGQCRATAWLDVYYRSCSP